MVASKVAPLLLVAAFSCVLVQFAYSQESTEATLKAVDGVNPLNDASYGNINPEDYVYYKRPSTPYPPSSPSYPSYPTKTYDVLPPGPGPCPKQCTCECNLQYTRQDNKNGCLAGVTCPSDTVGPTDTGALCTKTTTLKWCSSCQSYLASQNFAFCIDHPKGGDQLGVLCYQVKCPSSGHISISGMPVTFTDCCGIDGVTSGLFLYGGDYSSNSTAILKNKANLQWSSQCNEGDTYSVCEKCGIVLEDTLSFKFVGLYPKKCPPTCTQLSCTGSA